MKFSGTFLNSKIARRIATLLFLAAVIPTLLITVMSSNKVNQLVNNYEGKLLLENTRHYALSTFNNLIYVKSYFDNTNAQGSDKNFTEHLSINASGKPAAIFSSVTKIPSSQMNSWLKKSNIDTHIFTQLNNTQYRKVTILVSNAIEHQNKKAIYFIAYHEALSYEESFYTVAEVSNAFLWGSKQDYPEDIQLCVYQLVGTQKQTIFCSDSQTPVLSEAIPVKSTALNSINHASWELFLNGEFSSNSWLFETNRVLPLTQNHLKELVGSRAYIGIAIISLLAVALLSLTQIRRTMGPLDKLLHGTKKIQKGEYASIKVNGSSEFSELASAFNGMSSHIKNQFETMQSYSVIDREVASNKDITHVIELVLDRMQQLAPDKIFCITRIKDSTATEVQCDCTLSIDQSPLDTRLSMPKQEIDVIKQYQHGLIKTISMESQYMHERLLAEFSATQLWVFPIVWQGDIYGFICVGGNSELNKKEPYWLEFEELANRIGVAIAANVREQKLLLEAQYDNLTGLPNRILLRDRLKQAMDHSDKTGKSMWVVFIDLDRFKVVNDSMGHATGDALLKEMAKRLLAQTRDTDTVARFGGDEFVLVLSGDAGENIQISALQRMMNAIAEPIIIDHQELISTCSIGIAIYPDDGQNAEDLIKNADIAMYRAKETGRNNYQFFTQNLNDKAAKRMEMISMLRKAIDNKEFNLVFQPKINLASNKVVGLEALIRWHHPHQGHISPAVFMPIAEDAGLISPIGDWVLQEACYQIAAWHRLGFEKLLVSVNFSVRQFEEGDLIEKLKAALIETGSKATNLELELTETILMNISDKTIKTMHEIKSLGIQLSIDDFGTGYSNLSYLHTLPMDTLKIDKTFIDSISLTPTKAPIVDTILNLGKNLGLKVIAEGVETAEQVEYLKLQGCDEIQGYYFSKPVPAEEVTAMLFSEAKEQKNNPLKLIKNANATKKRS